MARLYLDEHLGGFLDEVRNQGHDAIAATEEGRRGRTDSWHFQEALQASRIILTWNKRDFEYLHRLWTTLRILGLVASDHSGILTKEAPRTLSEVDWLAEVMRKLQTSDVLDGRMLVFHQHTRRWEEDKWKPEE